VQELPGNRAWKMPALWQKTCRPKQEITDAAAIKKHVELFNVLMLENTSICWVFIQASKNKT
jgi:hypothetical protein